MKVLTGSEGLKLGKHASGIVLTQKATPLNPPEKKR